jgi:hypothetical protein
MGGTTIPLVALNARAPEQPDVMQKYGQLMQLKNAQQQSQMQAQQFAQQQQEAPLRLQALQNQSAQSNIALTQAQQAQKDEAATTAAMNAWDGKDPSALAPLVLKNGGSGKAVFGIKKTLNDWAQGAATLAKTNADTGKAQIDAQLKKNDVLMNAVSPLLDPSQVPDANLAQATSQIVQQAVQQKLIDPQAAQQVMQFAQAGDPAALRQGISNFSKTLLAHSQVVKEANDKAQREQAAQNQTDLQDYRQKELAQGQQRIGIEGARLKFEKDKGNFEMDASTEAMAQQIAKGDVAKLPAGRANPRNAAIMSRAYEINPQLSDALYTTKQNFKTKGDAQQVEGLATALEHLNRAQTNSKDVGYAPLLNHNATDADTRYNKDIQLYTEEVGKLIKNGVVTKDELHDLQSGLNSTRQGIRDAALDELTTLLSGKIKGKFQKYKTGTGQDMPVTEFFNDETQQRLKDIGISGGTKGSGTQPAPAGGFSWNDHPAAK